MSIKDVRMLRYYAERIVYFQQRIRAEEDAIQLIKQSDVWSKQEQMYLVRESQRKIHEYMNAKKELEKLYKEHKQKMEVDDV